MAHNDDLLAIPQQAFNHMLNANWFPDPLGLEVGYAYSEGLSIAAIARKLGIKTNKVTRTLSAFERNLGIHKPEDAARLFLKTESALPEASHDERTDNHRAQLRAILDASMDANTRATIINKNAKPPELFTNKAAFRRAILKARLKQAFSISMALDSRAKTENSLNGDAVNLSSTQPHKDQNLMLQDVFYINIKRRAHRLILVQLAQHLDIDAIAQNLNKLPETIIQDLHKIKSLSRIQTNEDLAHAFIRTVPAHRWQSYVDGGTTTLHYSHKRPANKSKTVLKL